MALETSWLEYLRISTPPTMLSSSFTPLGIFGITMDNSACTHCIPFSLLFSHAFFLPYGDDTPPSDTSYFLISCSGSNSRPYCVEIVVGSSCCGHFPLEASDSIRSTSSSTCNVVFSYFNVWILSTSTTMGISFVSVCGTRVLLYLFRTVLLGALTLDGDMARKSKLHSFKSTNGSTNSHFVAFMLNSAFFSLENNKMG
jgi:hypothetical protein